MTVAPAKEFAAVSQSWIRPRYLLLAALVLVIMVHGALLISGSYQQTYDAYVHIFFADHYRRNWFSSWDTRWYTGFSVLSYPPGAHQAVAIVSGLVGLKAGFVLVQLAALMLLVIGVYRWACLWVDRQAAGWAAIMLVLASSIAETVHVFGQLPTTFALAFLLNALPFAKDWILTGSRRDLVLATLCLMATTAGHHVTTLFGAVFFAGPVIVSALLIAIRKPLANEADWHPVEFSLSTFWALVARRVLRVRREFVRAIIFIVATVFVLLITVLPYWLHSASDPITQVSIPHASRDSFISNTNAGLVFWLVPWGVFLLVMPYAVVRGFRSTAWPLALSLCALFVLGTGGTTFIPKLLLGGAFDILTLDRFTFWATICILPFAGLFTSSIIFGNGRARLNKFLGRSGAAAALGVIAASVIASSLFAANLTQFRPFQPAAIDVQPIVNFLEKDDHSQWRYLTLGFGDQMAWLSANTTANTVDGNYHSARQLPELTTRPVERLEGAKYTGVAGIGSLQQFLATPGRYSLKYVFSNDDFYSPLLDASGWNNLGTLENGIAVWERADVAPLPLATASDQAPLWQRVMWGVIPLTAVVLGLCAIVWGVGGLRVRPFRSVRGHRVETWSRWSRLSLGRFVDDVLTQVAARVPRHRAARPAEKNDAPGLTAQRESLTRHDAVIGSISAGLVVTIVVGAAVMWVSWRPQSVMDSVVAYYDHLDFRRFSAAYELLDPETRPSLDEYREFLSRDGGLVASFAKLESVDGEVIERGEDRATVAATITYLTSLDRYISSTVLGAVRRDGRWYLEVPIEDVPPPPDQFYSRPSVGFQSQGRTTNDESTSAIDVLDRPELSLSNVRSLKIGARWIVIGSVTNTDVVPADVTVQAQLRDPSGELLASWDAAQLLIHKLRPGASSPFRIEFQSIAGTGAVGSEVNGGVAVDVDSQTARSVVSVEPQDDVGPVEFDPRTITPLTLPKGSLVASVDVYARAVVSRVVAPSGLVIDAVHTEVREDGETYITGIVRNDGVNEATVPHLLVSYFDLDRTLVWVDHLYLPSSIAPQASASFAFAVAHVEGLRVSGLPTGAYAGPSHENIATTPVRTSELPPSSQFASFSLDVTSFVRGSQ
jgi:hypothetical protein